MVRPERFERPTYWFVASCSIQLSYGRTLRGIQLYKDNGDSGLGQPPEGEWGGARGGTILPRFALYQVKAVMNAVSQRRSVMKNTRLTSILSSSVIACALAIGSLASAPSASAQSTTTLMVNIPFDFQTDKQVLPAGVYHIERESESIVILRGPGKAAGLVMMHGAIKTHPADHATVVFDRYGDQYFLRQVWTAANPDGLECAKSHAEKAALVAQNYQAPITVELAVNNVPQNQK
jgi:hypothetical protein